MSTLYNNNTPELLILVGPAGSGKTTFATELVKEKSHYKRVNRDDIRRTIVGHTSPNDYTDGAERAHIERHATAMQNEQILYWLIQGFSVVVDNAHLDQKFLYNYLAEFNHIADVCFRFFETPLAECRLRVKAREGYNSSAQLAYINKQHERFNILMAQVAGVLDDGQPHKKLNRKVFQNKKLPKCIIVDIDGAIAPGTHYRNSQYGSQKEKDHAVEQTKELIRDINGNWFKRLTTPRKIIYISGKEACYERDVVQWIKDSNLPFHGEILMRTTGDPRTEWEVKEELFKRFVLPKYHTEFVMEHNFLMHRTWTKLGLYSIFVNQLT